MDSSAVNVPQKSAQFCDESFSLLAYPARSLKAHCLEFWAAQRMHTTSAGVAVGRAQRYADRGPPT